MSTLGKIVRKCREHFVFPTKFSHFFSQNGRIFAHFEKKMGKIKINPNVGHIWVHIMNLLGDGNILQLFVIVWHVYLNVIIII